MVKIEQHPVILRKLTPSEGKKIKNIVTGDIAECEVWLGSEADENNYKEVDEPTIDTFKEDAV